MDEQSQIQSVLRRLGRNKHVAIGLALLLALLLAAYIDGGEEDVRPIERKIILPSLSVAPIDKSPLSLGAVQ